MAVVSLDTVVKREYKCFPTPRDVSTGSIVAFCRSKAETVFGPMLSETANEGEDRLGSARHTDGDRRVIQRIVRRRRGRGNSGGGAG